jgi:hypothetical protein
MLREGAYLVLPPLLFSFPVLAVGVRTTTSLCMSQLLINQLLTAVVDHKKKRKVAIPMMLEC